MKLLLLLDGASDLELTVCAWYIQRLAFYFDFDRICGLNAILIP